MPQRCRTCLHPDRDAIDRALVEGADVVTLARASGLTRTSVRHHVEHHLPEAIARSEAVREELTATIAAAEAARAETRGIDLMGRLFAQCELGDRLAEACRRYLADPDHPDRFDIGPRAADITVIYADGTSERTGEPIMRKARLDELLERVREGGYPPATVEARHADPRDLAVKLLNAQTRQTELLAKVLGQLGDGAGVSGAEIERVQTAVMHALADYPEARAAVVVALKDLDGGRS
jgi:multidrug efflux pump subunit AcrA (membrane-fusion protein)